MRRLPRVYVYLLLSRDGITYIGMTADLRRRLRQHHAKANRGFTRGRRWHLAGVRMFLDRETAEHVERHLKRSGAQKRAWIKRVRRRLETLCERHGIQTGHL